MTKRRISNSESEESGSEEMLSEEEEDDDNEVILKQEQQGISEYEKQRLARIAENRARMEALGLPKIASSLMGSSPNTSRTSSKIKGKRKVIDDDEDYRPNDNEDDHDEDDDDKLDGDDEEEFLGSKTPQTQSRKNKVKNKGSKSKKKASVQKHLSSSDYIDDGDDELMKAIALSLKDSGEVLGAVPTDVQDATFTESKGNARSKRKKSFTSRVQMTEDEMVVHFFHFDEAGKGSISMRDLRRVAIAHDFMWTDKDLAEMIQFFDTDGDGKLDLDDFRKIVSRCNMLRTSDNS
ncbi:hypothetical protein ERO13_A11G078900v2 [Gossypium hirsutum]|uniref:Uncharacterized protein DDB_G0283697 isoform X1 n=3 Tax=Gossypium TaxID=3633 RepID=A0A1U8JYK8_GOSHI|nr:uncharacterized protein DDB_G0283697 isoform X1 [Gossypium hirsutum]KAG4173738.1 hypothetical protein ERO13_A11G078900v2 [Gossypium hirsutum]